MFELTFSISRVALYGCQVNENYTFSLNRSNGCNHKVSSSYEWTSHMFLYHATMHMRREAVFET